jgi:hypothetical protein
MQIKARARKKPAMRGRARLNMGLYFAIVTVVELG